MNLLDIATDLENQYTMKLDWNLNSLFSKALNVFCGAIRIVENDDDFILQKRKSDLHTSEISPGTTEVTDKIIIQIVR